LHFLHCSLKQVVYLCFFTFVWSGFRFNQMFNNLSYILIINILIHFRDFSRIWYIYLFCYLLQATWQEDRETDSAAEERCARQNFADSSCIVLVSVLIPMYFLVLRKIKRDQLRCVFDTFQKFRTSNRYNCNWWNVLYILTWFFLSISWISYILDDKNPFKKRLI